MCVCVCVCAFPSFPPGLLAVYQHENDAIKYFPSLKLMGLYSLFLRTGNQIILQCVSNHDFMEEESVH